MFLGVDPSSTRGGITILDKDGNPKLISFWEKNKKFSLQENLLDCRSFIFDLGKKFKVKHISIEELSVIRNMNTVRKICYFEAMPILISAELRTSLNLIKTKTARKLVLGNGNLDKKDSYDIVAPMLTEQGFEISPFKKGGADQCDSFVIAKSDFIQKTKKVDMIESSNE